MKWMKRSTLLLILACFPWLLVHAAPLPPLPTPPPDIASDGPCGTALDALREGQEATAEDIAKSLADKGSGEAHLLLAFLLESLPNDQAKRSRYQAIGYHYRKAAEAGSREATLRHQMTLLLTGKEKEREDILKQWEESATSAPLACRVMGEAYCKEGYIEAKPNPAKAQEWYSKAARAGDARAYLLLGILHEHGMGSLHPRNESEAIDCYRKAAEAGEKEAFVPLGRLLLAEDRPDDAEGKTWLMKAASSGDKRAWQILSQHVEQTDPIAADQYDQQGAQAGAGASMFRISNRLMKQGKPEESKRWLEKSAKAGHPAACTALAESILSSPSPDLPSVFRLLQSAARNGDHQGQYQLALLYLDDRAGWSDPKAAFVWMTEAMKGKDPQVYYRLASMHEHAIGTPVNYANAGMLYTMACNKGHAEAACRIAFMAAEGLGTEPSPVQAWAYATLAEERGSSTAKELIAKLTLDESSKGEARKILETLR